MEIHKPDIDHFAREWLFSLTFKPVLTRSSSSPSCRACTSATPKQQSKPQHSNTMLSLFGFGPFIYGAQANERSLLLISQVELTFVSSELPLPQRRCHPLRRPFPCSKYVSVTPQLKPHGTAASSRWALVTHISIHWHLDDSWLGQITTKWPCRRRRRVWCTRSRPWEFSQQRHQPHIQYTDVMSRFVLAMPWLYNSRVLTLGSLQCLWYLSTRS